MILLRRRALLLLPLACGLISDLAAAPQPHPTQAGRLIETRDGFSVEYSPGQEAWMEMGFDLLHKQPPPTPPATASEAPPTPGSVRDLHARRTELLQAIARQVGLPAPRPIQERTFDTFLGYYDVLDEAMRHAAAAFPGRLAVRRIAIWQRDDLIRRLRAGEKIDGMAYDAATDSGQFDFRSDITGGPDSNPRIKAIYDAIAAQQLQHTFNYDQTGIAATVTPGGKPQALPTALALPPSEKTAPEFVLPVIYRGEMATPPRPENFNGLWDDLRRAAAQIGPSLAKYRDARVVGIIFHETAEIGLVDGIIGSADRRWLCDGTANYVAWRVARDFFGPEFAQQVYDLDGQLRQYAAQQPRIKLARWSAAEAQKSDAASDVLNRAHYAFATRAMFLLTARHGDDALATVWAEVAKTDRNKTTAKTFAAALRKRFDGDVGALVKAAEKNPIPPAPNPSVAP